MSGNSRSAGVAYVDLAIGDTKALVTGIVKSADESARTFSTSFSKSATSGIKGSPVKVFDNKEVETQGKKAGEAGGKGLSESLTKEAKAAGKKAGEEAGSELGARVKETVSESLRSIGTVIGLSIVGGGIARAFESVVDAASDAARINRLTAQVIKSTGDASHVSATQVHELADSLSRTDGVNADTIQSTENLILTFTGIKNAAGAGNDIFNQTTQAALDMAAALGEDSTSAAMQLGKALGDPEQGANMLRRAGVQLTKQQLDQIKIFSKSGDTLSAQKIILRELSKEFGGAAAAAASPMDKFKATLHGVEEHIGNAFLPALSSAATWLGKELPKATDFLIQDVFPKLKEGFGKVMSLGKDALNVAWPIVKPILDTLVSVVRDDLYPALKNLWSVVGTPIKDYFIIYFGVLKTIGEKAAPVLKDVGGAVKTAFQWLADHKDFLQPIVAGIIGGAAAWAAWQAVTGIIGKVRAAVKGLQTAFLLLDAAMDANPVGLIIVAIGALVAGVLYAWFHFAGFRDFLIKAWHDIEAVALSVWHNALEPFFHGVATVATWLWHNVLKPIFDHWKIILIVLLGPIGLFAALVIKYWHDIAAIAMWLWHNIIEPVFAGIRTAISVALTVLGPVFAFIVVLIKTVGEIFVWLYRDIVKPVWQAIQIAISIAWAIIEVVFGLIQIAIKIVATIVKWFYEVYWKPIFHAVVAILKDVVFPIIEHFWHGVVEPIFHGIADTISFVWNTKIKPIFDAMKKVIKDEVAPAFKAGVDAIGKAWSAVEDVAKLPIKFIINTVLNDGLLAAYNWIASKFGVKPDDVHVSLPKGFSEGGFTGAGGKHDPAGIVHAGEYVIPKETVDQLGPGYFNKYLPGKKKSGDGSEGLAAMFPGYSDGGFVGTLKNIWKTVTDPVKWLKDKALGLFSGIPGAGVLSSAVVGGGTKLVDGAIDWVKKSIQNLTTPDGFSGPISADVAAVQNWLKAQDGKPYVWASAGPDGYDCSGLVSAVYNMLHGKSPYSHTFSTSDEAGFFKPGLGGVLQVGYANPGERGGGGVGHTDGVLAGLPFESGGSHGNVSVGHNNITPIDSFAHIGHYDNGGILNPGQLGVNLLRKPEAILNPQQWQDVSTLASRGASGGDTNVYVTVHLDGEELDSRTEVRIEKAMDDLADKLNGGRRAA